jgi:hypothetical protein
MAFAALAAPTLAVEMLSSSLEEKPTRRIFCDFTSLWIIGGESE